MLTFTVMCAVCGAVQVPVCDLRVAFSCDHGEASYTFRCPSCQGDWARAAAPRVADALLAAGVPWTLAASPVSDQEVSASGATRRRQERLSSIFGARQGPPEAA